MATDDSFVEENARSLARMRALVERLDDDELGLPVNDDWTVAGVLAHTAFWDARVQALVGRFLRGKPYAPGDEEPEDVWWINDASRPFLHAIAPREAARMSLAIATETDELVATLPPERIYPLEPTSLINPFRTWHRTEHLDEIEALIGSAG
jgi:hypothetical protein